MIRPTISTQQSGGLVTIHLNAKPVVDSLKFFERHQMPFIVAATLTKTALAGQELERRHIKRTYKLHGNFIPYRIKMSSASKEQILSTGSTEARVYTDPKIGFMTLHEDGATKLPKGTALTPPSQDALELPGFKTATGKVSSKYQPKNLLKGGRKSVAVKTKRGKERSQVPNAFIVKGAIVRRASNAEGDKNNLVVLFRFRPRGKIKPTLKFEENLTRLTLRVLNTIYTRTANDALRDPRGPRGTVP